MITLPQSYRDAGFQRRIAELERAELGGRNEVWMALLAAPWVKDAPFDPLLGNGVVPQQAALALRYLLEQLLTLEAAA